MKTKAELLNQIKKAPFGAFILQKQKRLDGFTPFNNHPIAWMIF